MDERHLTDDEVLALVRAALADKTLSMIEAECQECGAAITFETGASSGLRGQPLMNHAECPACHSPHVRNTETGKVSLRERE